MCRTITVSFALLLAAAGIALASPQMHIRRLIVTNQEEELLFSYQFTYDAPGRIIQIDWLGADGALWSATRRYFNAGSNLVSSITLDGQGNLSATLLRTLDDLGRPRQVSTYDGNGRLLAEVAYRWTEQDQVVLRATTGGGQTGSAARMRRVKGSLFDAELVETSSKTTDGIASVKHFIERGVLVRTEVLYGDDRLPVQKRVFAYIHDDAGRLSNVQIADYPSRKITNQFVEWETGPVLGDPEDELVAWMLEIP